MTTYSTVSYRSVDGIATITLNRPPTNAMTPRMVRELYDLVVRIADQGDLRAVMLTGQGGPGHGFCPGADIKHRGSEEAAAEAREDGPHDLPLTQLARLIHDIPAITIAAINGAVAGAGLGLALACDLRVAARSARFATAFLARGLSGDMGVWWSLVRLVGPSRAREIGLLVDKFTADEAAVYGIVARVWDDEDFVGQLEQLGARLRQFPRSALVAVKADLIDADTMPFDAYLDVEMARHLALSGGAESVARFQQFLADRSSTSGET
jgi:2-(1,2-epoxy-1,2-dihydrophenyl)acetyl-CoA isomerase